MFLSRPLLSLLLVLNSSYAAAHEFWIEPQAYQVENGQDVQAAFVNGEDFEGITLSYFDRKSRRFEMQAGEDLITLAPRAGDNPALNVAAPADDSLLVVVHETTPSSLTYKEWAKFMAFADHKDFTTAAEDHDAAGWPRENFRESYTRHAKSLIALGSGEGRDRRMGLETEFVALTNPYAADFGDTMEVQLFLGDAPRPNAQVEVFDRAPDGAVTITLHRTDAEGMAQIPVTAGHTYLFDAVVLRPFAGTGANNDPVWETLWAALTFAVPR